MKTIKINKNSWHYRLIDKYTTEPVWHIDNFCEYFWGVARGIFSVFLIIGCGSIISWIMVGEPIMYAITGFDPVFLDGNDGLQIGLMIWGIILFVFSISFTTLKYQEYKDAHSKKYVDEPDSFIYTAYKSFKDKVCFKIEYEKEQK